MKIAKEKERKLFNITSVKESSEMFPEITVEQYSINLLNRYSSLASSTKNYYCILWNKLPMAFANKPLCNLTHWDLSELFYELEKTCKQKELDRTVCSLKYLFANAFRDGLMPELDITKCYRPKSRISQDKEEKDLSIYSDNDIEYIFKTSLDFSIEFYTMIALLECTGIRSGELRSLEWCDYDPIRQRIRVRQTAAIEFGAFSTLDNTPNGKRILENFINL